MRLFVFFSMCLASGSLLAADLPGSHDLEMLPRFPKAEIIDFREAATQERIYPQGSIRRISGQLRYEREVPVQGRLTAVTYSLPSEHSSGEAFDVARETLQKQGAELLYWCRGRGCGSSNLWANGVFGNSKLYGADEQQAYLLLRLAEPRQNSLLTLYSITRGNRKAYLHAELLDAAKPLGELLPTPATLLRQLKSSGELVLPKRAAEPEPAWAALLARSLNLDITLRVSLEGTTAEAWREALVGQGVRAARLELGEAKGEDLRLEVLR